MNKSWADSMEQEEQEKELQIDDEEFANRFVRLKLEVPLTKENDPKAERSNETSSVRRTKSNRPVYSSRKKNQHGANGTYPKCPKCKRVVDEFIEKSYALFKPSCPHCSKPIISNQPVGKNKHFRSDLVKGVNCSSWIRGIDV